MNNKAKQFGFTLVELLMAVVVVSVILGLGLTSFRNLTMNNQKTTELLDLVSSFSVARSEAVKRKIAVGVCASASGTDCDGGTWDEGWIVFLDADNNALPDNDTNILRVHEALESNTVTSNVGTTYLFLRTGFGGSGAGTLTFCDSRGAAEARAVVISATGRIRTSDMANDNSPLVC